MCHRMSGGGGSPPSGPARKEPLPRCKEKAATQRGRDPASTPLRRGRARPTCCSPLGGGVLQGSARAFPVGRCGGGGRHGHPCPALGKQRSREGGGREGGPEVSWDPTTRPDCPSRGGPRESPPPRPGTPWEEVRHAEMPRCASPGREAGRAPSPPPHQLSESPPGPPRHAPPYHGGVLLHRSLQQPFQDGPLSHRSGLDGSPRIRGRCCCC